MGSNPAGSTSFIVSTLGVLQIAKQLCAEGFAERWKPDTAAGLRIPGLVTLDCHPISHGARNAGLRPGFSP